MKRRIVLITLFSLVIGIGNVLAQKGISFHVSYNSDYNPRSYANADIREFHAFQKDVIAFSKAINRDKVRKARRIKNDLLRRMKNEINDTKQKIRFAKINMDDGYTSGLHKKQSRNNTYSKRKSNSRRDNEEFRHLKLLKEQLRVQKLIHFNIERMYLDAGRNFFSQGRKHEILLQDFETTLKSDINFSFKEYRTRNRN